MPLKYKILFGQKGEQQALKFLRRKKYKILTTNYRTKLGEIDIVAQDRNTLVFVEVKTRKDEFFSRPQEAVNWFKQQQIIKAALSYIKRYNLTNVDVRFDVVAILPDKIELIQNAFQSDGRYRY